MITLQLLLLLLALKPLKSFNIDTSKRWVSMSAPPHFGQRVFQHSDGRQSWILATSLGPGDSGRLFKCHLQDEIRCEVASLGEKIQKLKKLQSGIAIAQSPEQILVCLQHRRRQRRRATEELNGLCVLLAAGFQEKAFINLTDIIETKQNQGGQERKRRDVSSNGIGSVNRNPFSLAASSNCHQPRGSHVCRDSTDGNFELGYKTLKANNNNNNNNYYMEDEEEDESYLRTEIAFVLDGSGSIDPPDFERAKDFVYSMMKTSYEKCFECVFALVQYGDIIQTEFDLRDGKSSSTALEKVKAMTQVCKVTRTASAIQHVLDAIFSSSYGSEENAAKIIVVLTDGVSFMDSLQLETVINSSRMVGIERYAIGVGEAFDNVKALQELHLIASDPDERHIFRVTNYSALNVILSTLQQKIIGIEGTAGAILEFDLAQSGFSVHLPDEHSIFFGAVGAFDWSGGVLLYDTASEAAVFLNESKEAAGANNGYLGYSMGAVKTGHSALVVAGAPRHSMTGKVMVFEGAHLKQILPGEQIGSYYGSELCPLDIDQDGLTDYLLVGAPFFHMHGEEGKVYLYHLDKERITAAETGPSGLMYFGRSVAGGLDFTEDGLPDIIIGSLGKVTLLRSRPVIRLEPTMQFSPGRIFNFHNSSMVTAKLCFYRGFLLETAQPGMGNLLLHYTVDLDVEMEKKRAQFEDQTVTTTSKVAYAENSCYALHLYILPCRYDCFSSVVLRLAYQLHGPEEDLAHPVPMLDIYQESEVYFQLPFAEDCSDKSVCAPCLSLAVETEKELVVGSTKELAMNIHLANSGDNSHLTSLVLQYPSNLRFTDVQEISSPTIDCDTSQPTSVSFSSLHCKVGHPVFKKSTANFSVIWQLDGKPFPTNFANITLSITNANRNSTPLREEHSLGVKYAFIAILSRPLSTVYVSVGEGASQSTHFTFNINRKNQFGTQLQLLIWVPVVTDNHRIASIKNAAGMQNTTVCRTESVLSQDVWTDLGSTDSKDSERVSYQLVNCSITSEKEDVVVTAELPLANSIQILKDRTDLLVRGEIDFNRNLYVGLNAEHHKAEIKVILLKEKVFDFVPVIVGSSVGGFVLLLLIIVALCKCGFFKRNYKAMMEEQRDS
ncbi:integrin alpha-E isoform X2 [Rhineura floridana]|uniref:integrin alpha-E isoform X2 n=1 Tax=Rhineura floridana TaxID=261503 RepID=UPI002AC84CB8|nr:integrin alpha-E isoform X2 [Rhineura floridana]